MSELERINDREVALSPRDHSAIPDMIRPRQTQAFRCCLVYNITYNRLYSVMYYLLRFPVPQPGPRLASSTSHHPLPPQSRGPGLSFSRRNPSGASVASSRSYLKPRHCQCVLNWDLFQWRRHWPRLPQLPVSRLLVLAAVALLREGGNKCPNIFAYTSTTNICVPR